MIIALIIFLVLLTDWIIYRILLQKYQRETTQITAELIRLDIEDTGHFKIKGQDGRFYDYQLQQIPHHTYSLNLTTYETTIPQ